MLDKAICRVKTQFSCLAEVGESLFDMPGQDVCHTTAVIGVGELAVQCQRLVEEADGS